MTRFGLPDIDFIEDDVEDIELVGVAKFEELMGGKVTLENADPRRKMLQAAAYIAYLMLNDIEFTGKQNLITYAVDNYLDHKGAEKNVQRLKADYAKTIERFECNAIQEFIIPSGTTINAGTVSFASTEDVVVSQGSTSVDIVLTCTEVGEVGNGFLYGQINQIENPDNLPWVSRAYNITTSSGGSEIEDDNQYAERIQLASNQYAVAGSGDAYIYFAKTASQDIIDVYAATTSDAVVDITILMSGGELPTTDDKQAVLDILSDRTIRPLSDKVQVSDPVVTNYDLTVTYYVESTALQATVDVAVQEAVDEYVLWQKSKLGRGIDPSELYALIQEKTSSARRIVVSPNEYTSIDKNAVSIASSVTVTCGGVIVD